MDPVYAQVLYTSTPFYVCLQKENIFSVCKQEVRKMTFGERLKQARAISNFSQEVLAEKVSVTKVAISKYEHDLMLPSSDKLILLSEALGVDIHYFFRERCVALTSEPAFRMSDNAKLSESEQAKIIAQAQDSVEKHLEIMDIMNIPLQANENEHLRKEVETSDEIEDLAQRVREEWKLGLDPIENLMSVAENNGFKILLVNGPNTFEAATFIDEEYGQIIAMRRGAPKERQRFTLAHELGHYFILPGIYDEEQSANRFAAAFLMPRPAFIHDVGEKRTSLTPNELILLREKYGASVPAILVRMESLGIISAKLKSRVQKNHAHDTLRARGEVYEKTEKPRRVKLLVERAIAEGIITENKGYEILGGDFCLDCKSCMEGA
jgi:adenine deaminase